MAIPMRARNSAEPRGEQTSFFFKFWRQWHYLQNELPSRLGSILMLVWCLCLVGLSASVYEILAHGEGWDPTADSRGSHAFFIFYVVRVIQGACVAVTAGAAMHSLLLGAAAVPQRSSTDGPGIRGTAQRVSRKQALNTCAVWNFTLSVTLLFDYLGISYVWYPSHGTEPLRIGILLLMAFDLPFHLHVLLSAVESKVDAGNSGVLATSEHVGLYNAIGGIVWCLPRVVHRIGGSLPWQVLGTVGIILARLYFNRLSVIGHFPSLSVLQQSTGILALWGWYAVGALSFAADALELCIIWAPGAGITEEHTRLTALTAWMVFSMYDPFLISWACITGDEAKRLAAERDAMHFELAARDRKIQAQREAENARQKFMRYIFHEVRTPFNSIDMGLALLQEEEEENLSTEGRTLLGILTKAALSMRVIINDTLDWSRIQTDAFHMQLAPSRLVDIIQATVLNMMPTASSMDTRVQIHWEVDHSVPQWALADKVRLQQVVANLISNAIKFSPKDGTGQVTVRLLCVGEEQDRMPDHVMARVGNVWWKDRANSDSCSDVGGRSDQLSAYSFSASQHAEGQPTRSLVHQLLQQANRLLGVAVPDKRTRANSARTTASARGAPFVERRPSLSISTASGDSRGGQSQHSLNGFAEPTSAAAGVRVYQYAGTGLASNTAATPSDRDSDRQPFTRLPVLPFLATTSVPRPHMEHFAQQGFHMSPSGPCTVIIEVQDNGDGIQPAEIPALFQAFRHVEAGFQNVGRGTGLGLAICHEIVSLHGGTLGVRSTGRPGEGASFFVALRMPVLYHSSSSEATDSSAPNSPAAFAAQRHYTETGHVSRQDTAPARTVSSYSDAFTAHPAPIIKLPAIPTHRTGTDPKPLLVSLPSPQMPAHVSASARAASRATADCSDIMLSRTSVPADDVGMPSGPSDSVVVEVSGEHEAAGSKVSSIDSGVGSVGEQTENGSSDSSGACVLPGSISGAKIHRQQPWIAPVSTRRRGSALQQGHVHKGMQKAGLAKPYIMSHLSNSGTPVPPMLDTSRPVPERGLASRKSRTAVVQSALMQRAENVAALSAAVMLDPRASVMPVTHGHHGSLSPFLSLDTATSKGETKRGGSPTARSAEVTGASYSSGGGVRLWGMGKAGLQNSSPHLRPYQYGSSKSPVSLDGSKRSMQRVAPSGHSGQNASEEEGHALAHSAGGSVRQPGASVPWDSPRSYSSAWAEILVQPGAAVSAVVPETLPLRPPHSVSSSASVKSRQSGHSSKASGEVGLALSFAPASLDGSGNQEQVQQRTLTPSPHTRPATTTTTALGTEYKRTSHGALEAVVESSLDGVPTRPAHSGATGGEVATSVLFSQAIERVEHAGSGEAIVAVHAPGPKEPHAAAAVQQHEIGRALRVLVVDDASDNRRLLARTLQRKLRQAIQQGRLNPIYNSVQIDEAADGDAAIQCVTGVPVDIVASTASAGGTWSAAQLTGMKRLDCYDAITMDAEMPRLNGFATTQLLRAAGYRGPIFGCTGNALEADQDLLISCGADRVFCKPIQTGELSEALLEAWGEAER